jgi:hypothetical protein
VTPGVVAGVPAALAWGVDSMEMAASAPPEACPWSDVEPSVWGSVLTAGAAGLLGGGRLGGIVCGCGVLFGE